MKRARLLLLVPILALAGCGGPSHQTIKPPPPLKQTEQLSSPVCDPPVGRGHTGGCVPHQLNITPRQFAKVKLPPNHGLICDTYEGDNITSYTALAHSVTGCVFKAYETNYRQDSAFVRSWNAFKYLGKWHSAYIFLRAGNCEHEAQVLVSIVNSVGGFNQPNTGPPVVDSEVPSAGQDTACVVARLRQLTGRTPLIYTAPGTWPGGDHAGAEGWYAGYGNYSHSPCVWDCAPKAWQYTDGTFGPFPHTLPGYAGNGDISVDYDMTKLVVQPPDPYAKYPKAVRDFGNGVTASEYKTVKTWDQRNCKEPARRTVCKTTRVHLVLLLGRIYFIAGHKLVHGQWVPISPPNYKPNDLGSRAAGIRGRL